MGLGAVGSRCARQLLLSPLVSELVILARRPSEVAPQVTALGGGHGVELEQLSPVALARLARGAGVVLLAAAGAVLPWAETAVAAGAPVVSTCDEPAEVRALLALAPAARARGVPVVAGAAMAPGLSCLLAWWAASQMDEVTELHVATLGTGGPSCARRRHAALREPVEEWRAGRWVRKVAGSGRELVWFPGQMGADCYRVNRPDALLLRQAFPGLDAATARAAASRRDRFTSWLPMLRPPHPEGTIGAVRVEARGRRAGAAESVIVGAGGRPALLAGMVAAGAAVAALSGQLRAGAGGLASLATDPARMLLELRDRGARLVTFEGAAISPAW